MKIGVIVFSFLCLTIGHSLFLPKEYLEPHVAELDLEESGSSEDIGVTNDPKSSISDVKNSQGEVFPPQLPQLKVKNPDLISYQAPYQVNHFENAGTLGVGVAQYGGVLYPYVHPYLLAASNPFNPVVRLPPVYTSNIRYNPLANSRSLRGSSRTTREPREDEEEFLAQLHHDAMMPNILPTMSIPMARSYVSYYPELGGVGAVFPGHPGNCGVPILLSCSPNISKGLLGVPVPDNGKYENSQKGEPKHLEKDGKKKKSESLPVVLPEEAQ